MKRLNMIIFRSRHVHKLADLPATCLGAELLPSFLINWLLALAEKCLNLEVISLYERERGGTRISR